MWIGTGGLRLVARQAHRLWLLEQARGLLDLHGVQTIDTRGGFRPLTAEGGPRQIHDTARMVHCHAAGHLLGHPGSDRMVDHGMSFLLTAHRDAVHGGYVWSPDGNDTKQAYGHAFVLLAASSAKVVGHSDADALLADVAQVLTDRFWDEDAGASREEFGRDWSAMGSYRGQNSNMHLTEALMAAFEATGERSFLTRAERIAELVIDRHARTEGWRVAEHFHEDWTVDRDYEGDPMFRPAGTTPGHALEWSRLLVQLGQLSGQGWALEAARALFLNTVRIGWAADTGGFYYTLDWEDRPKRADRFWWPCAEGIGAAAVLAEVTGDPLFEEWYRRIWDTVAAHFIDPGDGGWFPELDERMRPVERVFSGKPDLYHALQACLIPLLPADGSVTRGLSERVDLLNPTWGQGPRG
ncbi:AGE family epimerase/isomerase [Cereibacter sp. SYSU M97828]|nr:AGE family epimerase/isomerase [Cereibacter flavus]